MFQWCNQYLVVKLHQHTGLVFGWITTLHQQFVSLKYFFSWIFGSSKRLYNSSLPSIQVVDSFQFACDVVCSVQQCMNSSFVGGSQIDVWYLIKGFTSELFKTMSQNIYSIHALVCVFMHFKGISFRTFCVILL